MKKTKQLLFLLSFSLVFCYSYAQKTEAQTKTGVKEKEAPAKEVSKEPGKDKVIPVNVELEKPAPGKNETPVKPYDVFDDVIRDDTGKDDVVQKDENGEVNWTQQYIEAKELLQLIL